ncbi:alpha/beta-hydrolase [Auricularia subglabra TFB-10046 SS5]|nr:alpha/beta-hydrolase [Auricularia subglabra TFB-10046 SS5]
MKIFLIVCLHLAAVATCSQAAATPKCTESITTITTAATNYDISTGNSHPPNATVPVSGPFGIQLRFCEPTARVPGRQDVLQVLLGGITYNAAYWDSAFEPDKYNYVRFAAARGYATLNIARLGYGKSDHPDPVLIQAPFDVAIIREIIKLARRGRIPGARRRFGRIVAVGHSYGSIILNGVIAAEPMLTDAVVLTGYSHYLADQSDISALVDVGPARDRDPAKFGHLPPDYITTRNASSRAAGFYGPEGTFDPAALLYDEANKDTTTIGELITEDTTMVVAPQYRGDVFTVNGAQDWLFCVDAACSNLAQEAQYYPAARSVDFAAVPNTGHSLNFQLSAASFYASIHDWLDRNRF